MSKLAAFIAISFVAIAVFGFVGLSSPDTLFSKCVSATVPGGVHCAEAGGAYVDFLHAGIFMSFSLALLTAVLLLALGWASFAVPELAGRPSNRERFHSEQLISSFGSQKQFRWLELHQQHPSR